MQVDLMKREKEILKKMITVFCQSRHKNDQMCSECRQLLSYAHLKLDKCPFKENKTACSKCKVHCYEPQMRQKIKEVMRYSGPRMIYKHPVAAIKHLLK